MQTLEFIIRSITDHGTLLTLTLQQEIKTEPVDMTEILKQRIDSVKDLDDDSRKVMKKILPVLLGSTIPKQNIAYSPIHMSITITSQIYERINSPKVGESINVSLSRIQ
ncbi:MAG: hypothetical protein EX285_04155 [Thaumarchaeota archaeon]|nr:hypothetical protein [Nitrososphaerota archaeon]